MKRLALIVPLASYTAWKRVKFVTLLVDSVVEPEPSDHAPAPSVMPEALASLSTASSPPTSVGEAVYPAGAMNLTK